MQTNKFSIQEKQYDFPYHYLVNFEDYTNNKTLSWGGEYYSYMIETINQILKTKFNSLIDVGCGDGKLINELAKKLKDKKFKGIDLSKPSIHLAKGLNYKLKNTTFETKDIKNIKQKYDVVVLNEVLEHIPNENYVEFCKNIENCMDFKSKLIVTVPTKVIPVQEKHYRHYDLSLVKKSFPNFKIIEKKYIYKKNCLSFLLVSLSSRNIIPKKIEKFIIQKFLKNANKKNGKHLLVVMMK